MQIIAKTITITELKTIAGELFGDMVKAVVDVERQVLAIDAELHADLEAVLLQDGSKQSNLWGINFYPDVRGEDFLEFDSMINVRPSQGNRSRGVEDKNLQKKIIQIVHQKIER